MDYLPQQRAMSPHTIQSYRDSIKLLLQFAAGKNADPSCLTAEALSVARITAFLHHLETGRHNQPATRNVRLSAIHSFFRYLARENPEYLRQAQCVLSIPFKRTSTREMEHMDFNEIRAVIASVDPTQTNGLRDRALLSLMINTGARVSEVIGLQASDLRLASPPSALLRGKGQKERTCPLWPETAGLLRELMEQQGISLSQPVAIFLNHRGARLSRFGARLVLKKYVGKASERQPSLKRKRLHPHSMRHSAAVHLLRSGVDISTIAHLLGHANLNTTNKYLAIDLEAKREALEKTQPLLARDGSRRGWRDKADLIAWLESL
ncbi:MAG: tyrosine-type recombinase/integrase [Verrucomicrobiia bacterium]